MATTIDLAAKGKVIGTRDGTVIFQPSGTNYELYLRGDAAHVPTDRFVRAQIRIQARKILTVPSGGNFIAPILGTPRTIQGMVKSIDSGSIMVHAGTPVIIDLPADDSAFDLANGPIAIGVMVNVVALPGAGIEFR